MSSDILEQIKESGVVAIVRGTSPSVLGQIIGALNEGGVKAVEVTFNTPGAAEMIRELVEKYAEGMLVGAGTVLDPETARTAMLAGASYILTPTLNQEVIQIGNRYGIPVIPGVMTPTEALTAWETGARTVKLFPAGTLGSRYIKDLRGPLPQIKVVPVGGISLDNAAEFIKAGAVALGVGSTLVNKDLIVQGRWDELAEKAAAFVKIVSDTRKSLKG